jgi:hypothetical protein
MSQKNSSTTIYLSIIKPLKVLPFKGLSLVAGVGFVENPELVEGNLRPEFIRLGEGYEPDELLRLRRTPPRTISSINSRPIPVFIHLSLLMASPLVVNSSE